MYVCMCVYMYIYIYIYTHTHTYSPRACLARRGRAGFYFYVDMRIVTCLVRCV